MVYANGRIPATALRVVQGAPMLSATANAYKTLILLGEVLGITVKLASGVGSAYRDLATQTLFWKAAHGDRDAIVATNLNGASTVAVAAPGYSSHGDGRKLDILFGGSSVPSRTELALANHCGFTRQFGPADPDHYMHDGRTAISGPNTSDWHRIVAFYLNGRHLGRTTTTVNDGIVDRGKPQNYTWEVQAAGIHDGLYPVPPFKHDGIPGPKTDSVEAHYRNVLWGSV